MEKLFDSQKFFYLWMIFASYGVFFALFSWFEEISTGKIWKGLLSLFCGFVIFLILKKCNKIFPKN